MSKKLFSDEEIKSLSKIDMLNL